MRETVRAKGIEQKSCNSQMTGAQGAESRHPHVACHRPRSERTAIYRFFLNLYSTPTEMAKFTSVCVIFDP